MDVRQYNTCTRLLFPICEIPKEIFYFSKSDIRFVGDTFSSRYINSYFYDEEVDVYDEGHIFVAHRNYMDPTFDDFESKIQSLDNYVDSYDICHGKVGVKIFRVPEDMIEDYNLIIDGKYSQISKEAIQRIGYNSIDDKELTGSIIIKSEELKSQWEKALSTDSCPVVLGDQEVWPIVSDKFQLVKNTLNNEIRRLIYEKIIVPNLEFDYE